MRKYDFSYKDNEGDTYESDQYDSKREAEAEIKRLREYYDGDFRVIETWIYEGDVFKGRW